jgi:hypothetical protein
MKGRKYSQEQLTMWPTDERDDYVTKCTVIPSDNLGLTDGSASVPMITFKELI